MGKDTKFILVLISLFISFAIGLSLIVYGFANSSIDGQTPVKTQTSDEGMF